MRQCSISLDHAPQNMDAALSLTPTGLSRGNFQLWIERTVRRKAIESEQEWEEKKKAMEVPLKGVSPFVWSPCSFYIYLNSDRKVDFLRVLGYSQQQRRKCGGEMERHEIKSVQNERYRQPEIERNASLRVLNAFSIPPVGKDND